VGCIYKIFYWNVAEIVGPSAQVTQALFCTTSKLLLSNGIHCKNLLIPKQPCPSICGSTRPTTPRRRTGGRDPLANVRGASHARTNIQKPICLPSTMTRN